MIYNHFIENYGPLLEKESPYLHYVIIHTEEKMKVDALSLDNIVFVFNFLSKIKKIFNLKLRKSEKDRLKLEDALNQLNPK